MPRFVSPEGDHVIETAIPREAAQLRAEGFTEQAARTKAVREADSAKSAEQTTPAK